MNALRAWLAHVARAHVALAERMTPAAFARVWTGVAVGALVGIVTRASLGAGTDELGPCGGAQWIVAVMVP